MWAFGVMWVVVGAETWVEVIVVLVGVGGGFCWVLGLLGYLLSRGVRGMGFSGLVIILGSGVGVSWGTFDGFSDCRVTLVWVC